MLIGIPALLGPELLATLRAMGHGDEIAIVDGNYPALEERQPADPRRRSSAHPGARRHTAACCRSTTSCRRRCFAPRSKATRDSLDPVHREMIAICARRAPGRKVVALRRRTTSTHGSRRAHAIVATSEPRLYGNIIIRKGVIYPAESGAIMILCCGEALIDMLPRESHGGRAGLCALCRRRGLQHGDRARPARRSGRVLLRPVVGPVRQPVPRRAGGEQGRFAPMPIFRRGRPRSPSCGSPTATRPTPSTTRTPPAAC